MKDIEGLDLVDATPEYGKTAEENDEIYKDRYFKVYGEYPPSSPEENK